VLDYAQPLRRDPRGDPRLLWIRRKTPVLLLSALSVALIAIGIAWFYCHPSYRRESGVVYGKRGHRDLTLDVLTPSSPNGFAIAVLNSSGWRSAPPRNFRVWLIAPLLQRGYTVFIVGHVSAPEASVAEIVADTHRSIRFIRFHAARYRIDPGHIGVVGGSAGGHLALMLATHGGVGPERAGDLIDREDSSVQAAAVFFPPTDLLNLGKSTVNPGNGGPPLTFERAFRADGISIEDWQRIGRDLSPIYQVTNALPPVLIVHGDADTLVPIDQSQRFQQKAQALGRTVELSIHRGGTHHGGPLMIWDVRRFAGWFDRYLRHSP
jgi:acetyl esterase/lipase